MIAIGFLLSYGALTLFIAALLIAAVSDAKTREIPNSAPLLLLIAGVLNILTGGPSLHGIVSALLGMFLGGFPLFILALWRKTIGGGDVKLAASAGFALGWLGSYLALIAALIGFVLFGLFHLPGKKEKDEALPLPFAPFYAAAGFGAFLFFAILRHSLVL
jgi:leader peptidase (prepilin peptidase)/N-methyltransferase